MANGDSDLTAIAVARECNIIPTENSVHRAEFDEAENIKWTVFEYDHGLARRKTEMSESFSQNPHSFFQDNPFPSNLP